MIDGSEDEQCRADKGDGTHSQYDKSKEVDNKAHAEVPRLGQRWPQARCATRMSTRGGGRSRMLETC
ncbi:hypothetical protein GCM10009102_07450 [Sphingomonas insulae]|uniref:Uncharacterized protein n=1 Tax=Sphingomonas insulae TaxID=424800 RepID=A0ABN1HPG2_9SPHN